MNAAGNHARNLLALRRAERLADCERYARTLMDEAIATHARAQARATAAEDHYARVSGHPWGFVLDAYLAGEL